MVCQDWYYETHSSSASRRLERFWMEIDRSVKSLRKGNRYVNKAFDLRG